jgi:methylenetetrahydrofolate reductase (NADH)
MPGGAPAIRDLLAAGTRSYSFEFFPPRNAEGELQLWQAIRRLEPLRPTFVSVTYGAGGSTRDRTVRVTERIATETTLTPMGHLTCFGTSPTELRTVIGSYAAAGVHNVLALRGDPPRNPAPDWVEAPDAPRHAGELVGMLRELGDFCVGVAAHPEGHPESGDLELDAKYLVQKAAAGAAFAITQFFFTAQDYFDLVARVARAGSDLPIIPGIMPVTNVRQIQRMAELSGAAFPAEFAEQLLAVEDDPEAVRRIGVAAACRLCDDLLAGGAPGVHFYTLNRSTATMEMYAALGLAARR